MAFALGRSAPPRVAECLPIQRQENMLDYILRFLLDLLFEDYKWVKEEAEKQSFPNAEELSLSSLFFICVGISSSISRELPERRGSGFHL